ncbi:MAG TPA: hypothetical protein VMW27_20115 [Thermoanaerobaculia bacterium]|nr:hypothetical protein [Thermoanaerobaculia bacterium]
MRPTRLPIPFLLLILLCASALEAGVGRWTPIGPDGGSVTALAVAPNGRTLYAGTPNGGVFKSINTGRSWTVSSRGLRGVMRDLEVDPASPRTVYAATFEGLFRSDDAGGTWVSLTAALLPQPQERVAVRTVAVDPSAPGTVYASLDSLRLVVRSTDRGASWQIASAGLGAEALSLAVDPNRAGLLYAATPKGVFRSRDAGRTWFRQGLGGSYVLDVAVDSHRSSILYAGVLIPGNHGSNSVRTFASQDGGRTWTAPRQDISGFYSVDLVADPFTPDTAWAAVPGGLFKTTDGGRSWQAAPGNAGGIVLAASPTRPGTLFAGGSVEGPGAVLKTTDGGASWAPAGPGITATFTLQVVPDPVAPGTLYVRLACCSVWKTEDGGAHWRRLSSGLPSAGYPFLAVDPATSTPYLSTNFGLYKSLDQGETWSSLWGMTPTALAFDPTSPGTILAGLGAPQSIARSTDGGQTWSFPPSAAGLYTTVLAAALSSPQTVYANGLVLGPLLDRVRRSDDGGLTWTTVLAPGLNQGEVKDIAVDPIDPRRVLVAFTEGNPTTGRLYRTTDGGATWTFSRLAQPILSLALDPREPLRVYAGGAAGAAFLSEDGGETWSPLSDGLPPGNVLDLQVDPFDPDTVYAAVLGGSVYAFTLPSGH